MLPVWKPSHGSFIYDALPSSSHTRRVTNRAGQHTMDSPLAPNFLAVPIAARIELCPENRVGEDSLDRRPRSTNGWFQLDAHPSDVLPYGTSLLLVSDALARPSGDLYVCAQKDSLT